MYIIPRKALEHTDLTGGKVTMLLNLSSLCHPSRHDSFMRRPPVRIYALDECVCYPNGDPSLATRHTRAERKLRTVRISEFEATEQVGCNLWHPLSLMRQACKADRMRQ